MTARWRIARKEARSMATAMKEVEIVDLDREHAFERFDHACRRYLSMSAMDFIKKYKHGDYEDLDVDTVPGLPNVLAILPFAGL